MATNKLRVYYRRKKYSSSLEALERHQAFQGAQSHLAHLPVKYQEVLVLRFAEEKKIIEIGQILGKKWRTLLNHYYREGLNSPR